MLKFDDAQKQFTRTHGIRIYFADEHGASPGQARVEVVGTPIDVEVGDDLESSIQDAIEKAMERQKRIDAAMES